MLESVIEKKRVNTIQNTQIGSAVYQDHFVCLAYIPLPNDKTVALSKLKAFGDNKCNVACMPQFLSYKVEKTLRKNEKMLLTTIFSYNHIFKRFPPPQGLLLVYITVQL